MMRFAKLYIMRLENISPNIRKSVLLWGFSTPTTYSLHRKEVSICHHIAYSSLRSEGENSSRGRFVSKVSYCCPSSVQDIFSGGLYKRDALTDFFDEVRQRCRFRKWFFGHYHENMVIVENFIMLYEQIIRLK